MLAAAFLVSPAVAGGTRNIADRVESAFQVILETSAVPAERLARHASARRVLEQTGRVAALPYSGVEPELAAFHRVLPAEPSNGAFRQSWSFNAVRTARLPRPRPEAPFIPAPIVTASLAPAEIVPVQAEPAAAQAAPQTAGETEFFGRFAGSFAGSGEVKRSATASANKVDCTLTGRPSPVGVSISGKCGAFVFSRDVHADIRFDPGSQTYTGTYSASSGPPATLWGKRQGDAVVLTITWPKIVNGDTKATMTIRNAGDGRLAISVLDRVNPGGPVAEVTRLALSQI